VIAGLDRGLNYDKLRRATLLIRSGVPFFGTNPDKTFPTPDGQVPGAGALLALLEAASGVSPIIIGKPNPAMYRLAMQRLGARLEETLAVGDRLETDIAGAQALGCPCALVLSGVSSREAAQTWQPTPDLIASDLGELLTLLPGE
jgi:4-nitrophenyl phosphatase